jgi:acetyl esterase/lipase
MKKLTPRFKTVSLYRGVCISLGIGLDISLWCSAALAQAPAPLPAPSAAALPAEAFFKHPEVLDAQLSPSGALLAITTSLGAQRVALVVLDPLNPKQATRIALFHDADVVRFQWVNNKRLVFSVVDLESGSGENSQSGAGLYGVDADGKDLRILIARRGLPIVSERTAKGTVALPPNHQLLQVPQPAGVEESDDVIVGEWVANSARDLRAVVPLRLDSRTGRTQRMALDAPAGSLGWLFDSQGQARVAITQRGGRRAVHWRGPGQSEWQLLSESDALHMPFSPHHVDDSGQLYVTNSMGPHSRTVLSRYDFERRAPARVPWVSVEGFDFSGRVLTLHPSNAVAGVRFEADAEDTVWFDEAMKRFQQQTDERMPGGTNRISCRRCNQPDMVALVRHFSDRNPGQLWFYSAASGQWRSVSPVLSGINPALMAQVDLHRIKARDGRDLPVWLTLPAGRKPGSPGPTVVLVHGGPWLRGGHWRWSPLEQFLASRGYLVISPEFRGSTGYGRAHFEAGWKQWGQAMQDDVADAVLWAQAQGLADKRVCIAGASYGGYSTLMGLVRHPELYRCGAAWVALTDPFLLLEGSWWVRDDISDSGRRYSLPQMVGDAKLDADMLTRVSPVAQAEHIKAPVLLAFGEADLRVPLAHGKRLREAMQKAGREPLWVTYPGEGHSWRLPQTRADFARRLENFLAEHLQ